MTLLTFAPPGVKAQEWVRRDNVAMSPSLTRGYPFVMARGAGSEVWDVDGRRFVDMNATIAVAATGHSHPAVVDAIQRQAEQFIQYAMTDFYTPPTIELAEMLNECAAHDLGHIRQAATLLRDLRHIPAMGEFERYYKAGS